MIVRCDFCGKRLQRNKPRTHYFCNAKHRDRWLSENIDFSALSKLHKAKHLTELNLQRNKFCRIAERGKVNSKKARAAAEQYLGRPLAKDEVVHHINGCASDNRPENILVMTNRQHKQLHMELAMERHDADKNINRHCGSSLEAACPQGVLIVSIRAHRADEHPEEGVIDE